MWPGFYESEQGEMFPKEAAFYQRYLENPRVWVPIFRTLLETSISKQQADDLIAEYDATPPAACPPGWPAPSRQARNSC